MMRMIALLSIIASLTGCTSWSSMVSSEGSNQLIDSSYAAIDRLVARQPSGSFVALGRKVLVATLVDLDNLNRSSSFGRLVAEQLSSRLVQLGVTVSELKLRGNLYVSEKQGELLLSREVKEIVGVQMADVVLVGTYSNAGNDVYVTLKLVRANDATIVSAYNYSISKVSGIQSLLKPDR